MQQQKTYWNRVGYINIMLDDGKLHQFGGMGEMFDMKFDGIKHGDFYSEFKCSILGLTREHINMLTVWDIGRAVQQKRYIEVYAGYSSNGSDMAKPIFSGYVMNAIPTPPPEMWVNFECIKAWDKDDCIVGVPEIIGAGKKEILKKIAELTGLEYSNKDSWQVLGDDGMKTKHSFTFSGNKRCMLPNAFSKQFDLRVIDQNGTIIAADNRGWIATAKNKRIQRRVDQDTGLLAIGSVDIAGAKIVHRLDNGFKLLSWIDLQSRLIPNVGDKSYFVTSMRHIGHLRGEQWQTEVELIRENARV